MKTIEKLFKSKQNKKVSGSEILLLSLLNEGVREFFGYPGGAIMPVYDMIYQYEDYVKHYLARHEQGAIHAAQGYARVSGDVGVCFATSGPGATNLITGIADAMIDSTPLVCITGQVASHLLGTDAFQETDVIGISMPVTKWNYQVDDVNQLAEVIAKAFYIAKSGRPGPVLIDITKDAQNAKCKFDYQPCLSIPTYIPNPDMSEAKQPIQEAAKLIDAAKKPFVLIGQGIILSGAEKALKTFLEKTGIPAASTLLGLGALSDDHPLYMGYLGMHGNYAPNVLTNKSDLIIAIGMRFDDRVTGNVDKYAKKAKIIHIDIDAAEINKIIPTDIGIVLDAKKALSSLVKKVKQNTHDEWLKLFKKYDKEEYKQVIKPIVENKGTKIKMAAVVKEITSQTKGNAVIVTDVGQHQMVTSRYFKYIKSRTNITSGGLGTMGFALPAAMGAAVWEKKIPVIAIIGDGGFQMTLQELGCIAEYGIKLKIVILNNEFLGMVRQWQQMFFDKRYAFTKMHNPDFCKIAEAYGIDAMQITKRNELKEGVKKMLANKETILVEIKVEKEDNVFPMVPTGASVSEIRLK